VAAPSILSIDQFLLVTLHRELSDADIEPLQADVGARVVETAARGVILDLSGVAAVDSYTGRVIAGLEQIPFGSERERVKMLVKTKGWK
jgi:rsbT antagonist protein RsbS